MDTSGGGVATLYTVSSLKNIRDLGGGFACYDKK